MKINFAIEYDTDTKTFTINGHSDNIKLSHSGSSFLRINGDSIYGTMSTLPDIDKEENNMFERMQNEGWRNFVISLKSGNA